jgi:uncharacterized protein
VTRRLATGSVPAAILTLTVLYKLGVRGSGSPPLITIVLACALILTAICVVSHRQLRMLTATRGSGPDPRRVAVLTILAGLRPRRAHYPVVSRRRRNRHDRAGPALCSDSDRQARWIDIAHAVPLTLIAGIGHWLLGSVNWLLLSSLLIGSLPGVYIGSHFAALVPDRILRPPLAGTLLLVGIRMLRS